MINDITGTTICAASSLDSAIEKAASNQATATKVGELIASRAKEAKLSKVVFDRGGHLYHGKVKALAEAAREAGLTF